MSNPEYLPFSKLRKIWSPEDSAQLAERATKFEAQVVPEPTQTDDEFNADMAYLRGISGALFEYATPTHMMKLAADAGLVTP